MSEPWSIPPLPQYGDKDIDVTYAAVGRALSAWEEIELWLAVLYARFLEIPPIQAINLPEFRNAAIFRARSQQVQNAASAFFTRRPNQGLEKEFEDLICELNRLSQRRNDIAHGIVRLGRHGESLAASLERMEYFLTPPTYGAKKFGPTGTPAYLFSSVQIDEFRSVFLRYQQRVQALAATIEVHSALRASS